MKYLTLIRSIALLHQWQRPRKTVEHRGRAVEYIEVTLDDIATANRLAHEVLGRSLDELPPQTRRLLLAVDEMVTAECERQKMERSDYRFSRRDVREATGWGDTQLKIHLHRLEELEYLLIHRGGRGQSFVYELMFTRPKDGGKPVLGGLIDVDALSKHAYDEKKSGPEAGKSGSSRPQVGGVSGVVKSVSPPIGMRVPGDAEFDLPEITYTSGKAERSLRRSRSGGEVMARIERKRKPQAHPGDGSGVADAGPSARAGGAELLRAHGAQPPGLYRLFPSVVQRARAYRSGGSHAARAGAVSAASVPLPQEERRAVELPLAAHAACALAGVVPVDDAAESHPAQSGFGDRAAAPRPHPAQEHLLRPGGRADHAALRRSRSPSACATAPSWKCCTRPACAAWRQSC